MNGMNTSQSHSQLHITGNSSVHSVKISSANMTTKLSMIHPNTTIPMPISNSCVTIMLTGSNYIQSSSFLHADVKCYYGSNLSVVSIGHVSLFDIGGSESSGIGSAKNGICRIICIVNGSLSASGDTGIGSGSLSEIRAVVIQSGEILATRLSGSGIGSGDAQTGRSILFNLTIMEGNDHDEKKT
jgi:hypothetical protein